MARLFKKEHLFSRLTESLVVDISATKNQLNWKPPYTFLDSLNMFMNKLNKDKND